MNLLLYVLHYIYTHNRHTSVLPLLIVTNDLIGQSDIVHAQCIHHVHSGTTAFILSQQLPSLMLTHHASYGL